MFPRRLEGSKPVTSTGLSRAMSKGSVRSLSASKEGKRVAVNGFHLTRGVGTGLVIVPLWETVYES